MKIFARALTTISCKLYVSRSSRSIPKVHDHSDFSNVNMLVLHQQGLSNGNIAFVRGMSLAESV